MGKGKGKSGRRLAESSPKRDANKKGRHEDGGDDDTAIPASSAAPASSVTALVHAEQGLFPIASPYLGSSHTISRWMEETHRSFESLQGHNYNLKRTRAGVEYLQTESRLALVVCCDGNFAIHLDGMPIGVRHISQFPDLKAITSKEELQVVMGAFGCLVPCDGIIPPSNMELQIKWNEWESVKDDLIGAPCIVKVPGTGTRNILARAKQDRMHGKPNIIGRKCGLVFHKDDMDSGAVCCPHCAELQDQLPSSDTPPWLRLPERLCQRVRHSCGVSLSGPCSVIVATVSINHHQAASTSTSSKCESPLYLRSRYVTVAYCD